MMRLLNYDLFTMLSAWCVETKSISLSIWILVWITAVTSLSDHCFHHCLLPCHHHHRRCCHHRHRRQHRLDLWWGRPGERRGEAVLERLDRAQNQPPVPRDGDEQAGRFARSSAGNVTATTQVEPLRKMGVLQQPAFLLCVSHVSNRLHMHNNGSLSVLVSIFSCASVSLAYGCRFTKV